MNRLAANMKMNPKEIMKMDPIPVKCAKFGSIFQTHHMFASAHRVIYIEDAELKVVLLHRFEVDGSGPSGTAKVRERSMQQVCTYLLRWIPSGIATLRVLTLFEGLRVNVLC